MPATSTRSSTWLTDPGAKRSVAACILCGALAIATAARGAEGPAVKTAPATYQETLLEVDINKQGINKSTIVLRRNDGVFLLKSADLADFRLKIPSTAPAMHDGTPYFPLTALAGARFEMDEVHQRLTIMAGTDAFEPTVDVIPGGKPAPQPVVPATGFFLNYDVNAVSNGGSVFVSNISEGGFFTPRGVFVTSVLGTRDDEGVHGVRLESTFTSDFPARHETLRIGDWISRPGAWGSAARFGGLNFGTNFTTEPGFRTYPSQPMRGQAVVPSTVDVYVNNALVSTRRVDPGPFTLSNIPFTTGGGTVRLVMRDLANQQQVVTISDPFYSSNTVLKAGLVDYSAEIGKVREDFGIESFHYGDAFASGTYRRGITDRFTAEVHGEGTHSQQAVGTSMTVVTPFIGQVDGTLAGSRSQAGNGSLAGIGYQHQLPTASFGGQVAWSSPNFRRMTDVENARVPRLQQAYSVGFQLGRAGSTTISYVSQKFHDGSALAVTSLGYSVALTPIAQLNLSAVKTRSDQDDGLAVAGSVTVLLGPNTNASVQAEKSRQGSQSSHVFSTSFQRNRSDDDPYSYRFQTRGSDIEAVGQYRGERFEGEFGLSRFSGADLGVRAEIRGGIGYMSGYTFLSRRITGSFGVVQVADYPNVGILLDNQYVGRTNSRGYFVVPDLRAYDRNAISVRDTDLPMDATVGALKLDATPYFRSGIVIRFPIRHLRAGVVYLELEDGSPLPSGAVVRLEGQDEEFPVALGGEAYVNGFGTRDRLVAQWKGQTCAIDLVYPQGNDPLPDLGKHVCKGVRP